MKPCSKPIIPCGRCYSSHMEQIQGFPVSAIMFPFVSETMREGTWHLLKMSSFVFRNTASSIRPRWNIFESIPISRMQSKALPSMDKGSIILFDNGEKTILSIASSFIFFLCLLDRFFSSFSFLYSFKSPLFKEAYIFMTNSFSLSVIKSFLLLT